MHVFVENLITVSSSDLMASSNSPNEWRSVIVMVVVVWWSDVYPTVFLEFDQATPGIGAGVTEWVELRRSDHVVGLNVELSFGVSGFAVILFVTALLTSPFHPPDNLRSPTLRRALSVPCQDLVRHPAINVTTFPPSNQMTVIGHVNVWNASTWAQFHVFVIIWPHCFVCFFTTSSYKYSTCTWPKQGAYVCAKSDGSKKTKHKSSPRVHQRRPVYEEPTLGPDSSISYEFAWSTTFTNHYKCTYCTYWKVVMCLVMSTSPMRLLVRDAEIVNTRLL